MYTEELRGKRISHMQLTTNDSEKQNKTKHVYVERLNCKGSMVKYSILRIWAKGM